MSPEREGEENKKEGTGDLNDKSQEEIVANLSEQLKAQGKMLEEMKTARDQLSKELKESKGMLYSPEYIEFMDKKGKGKGDKGSSDKGEDKDLNALSRAELVTYTQKGMETILTDVAKKWDEELDDVRTNHFKLMKMADVEFMKLREPAFKEWLATEEGKEEFLKIADANKEWGSQKIFDDKKKQDLVIAKEKADQEEAQAEEEKEVWSEKPGQAASIADEKGMSDDEIASKHYDALFGDKGHEAGVETPAGVIQPIKEK